MKRSPRLLSILLCMVVALLGSLLVVIPAQATSVYDDSYQGTSVLQVGSTIPGQQCDTTDVTYNWYSYLTQNTWWYGDRSTLRSSFLAALNDGTDGAWGVSQYDNGSLKIVEFWWTQDPTAQLSWTTDGVDITTSTSGANIYLADIVCMNYYYGGGSSRAVVGPTGAVHSYRISTSTAVSLGYTEKLLFVHGFDLNRPDGYDGPTIVTTQPHAKYVAMGDSFSSGEGNPPFEVGSDYSGIDECHRSSDAYPRLLASELSLSGSTAFVACSGATTTSVLYGNSGTGNWNEGPQVDALSDDTELVTITVGGNDVGFKDYLIICGVGFCGVGTSAYTTITDNISDPDFTAALESTYEAILEKAPNAELYVMDYPYITADDAGFCGVFDFIAGRGVQTMLNSTISDAVASVSETNSHIHYVPTNSAGSPFEGKYYCNGGDTDFTGLDPVNWEYSFHPNIDGQSDYAAVIATAIS